MPQNILEQLDPGTSMGGARPKATLEDDCRLWLGKFPEKADRCNLPHIEYATLQLARNCGLHVANARIETIGGKDVLMVARFDRQHADGGYLRFGLVSGLTMLGSDENYLDRDKWSYPLLADNLRRWSAKPDRDCAELFRRVVFNAAVTNNDDHPRNHAAIRTHRGWHLSPAYDLVPMPVGSLERRDLALTIGRFGRSASIYNIVSECARFGVTPEAAAIEIDAIVGVIRGWRENFHGCGVSAQDIEYIAPAFLPPKFFVVFLLYTVLGCLVESVGMIAITVPLLFPMLPQFAIDPVWFGIILVLFVEMGQISPPIGINLVVVQAMWTGKLQDVVMGTIPFHLLMVVLLIALVAWPQLVLWLPSRMIN